MLQQLAVPVSAAAFGRTGKQFFLSDRDGGRPPLLYRLSQDHPEEGLHFMSALHAFETRTVYSNVSGDHLVGWANSSLRAVDELPVIKIKGRGVVRADPLEWAWAPEARARLHQHPAAAQLDATHGHTSSVEAVMRSDTAQELVGTARPDRGEKPVGSGGDGAPAERESLERAWATGTAATSGTKGYIHASLRSLQQLPSWRRVDVCFGAAALPLLAHQHMQVQRKWLNWAGLEAVQHLALQLAAMEQLRRQV